jgi:hypothetical protein
VTAPALRIYVNEQGLTVPHGATVASALRLFDAGLAESVGSGGARVTDGRGIAVSLDAPLSGGSILRVIRGGGRSGGSATDALP